MINNLLFHIEETEENYPENQGEGVEEADGEWYSETNGETNGETNYDGEWQDEDPNYVGSYVRNEDASNLDDSFLSDSYLAVKNPPPVDADYWNVVNTDEDYSEMTLTKYGRGYLLKCPEDHPDFGIKYYPDNNNCLGWWLNNQEGWFIKRENKNYFLEKGAIFNHTR